MKLNLKRIETPFVLELSNEANNTVIIDANPVIGGKGLGFRPMELLAGSLASCASIDTLLILQKQRIELLDYSVEINAVRKEGEPSPFEKIELTFRFDASVDLIKANKAIALSLEKYCSVAASLNNQIELIFTSEHN
jgi:putative redox protein